MKPEKKKKKNPRIDSFEPFVLKNWFDAFYGMWTLATGICHILHSCTCIEHVLCEEIFQIDFENRLLKKIRLKRKIHSRIGHCESKHHRKQRAQRTGSFGEFDSELENTPF